MIESLLIIVKYHLKDGIEIEKQKIDEILLESESLFAFNKALKYISKSMKTTYEIENYLLDFKSEVVKNVIEKLTEYKFLNDENYIKTYIDFYKEKYGKLKLKMNLLNKKLDKELIEKYLSYEDDTSLNNIVKEIKKQSKNKQIDLKLKQKIIRNLSSKGYSFEEIKKGFILLGEDNESWD